MRIGTRRSALALAQAELVAKMLSAAGAAGGTGAEIVPVVTSGDRGSAGPADKSRWVEELELALLDGRIDLAVHSAKDVPGELAGGTALLGAPARAPAEDVLCGADGIERLAPGARIGTSSVRRVAQLRAARDDLDVVAVRGNVDTRLAKLAAREGGLDAIVLARAGLVRLGREGEACAVLDAGRFVPAPGQGTLALQGRRDDENAREAATAVCDPVALACLRAERALAAELHADCNTPLGAHATAGGEGALLLRAWVGLPDGSEWVSDELRGETGAEELLGAAVASRLRAAGVERLLDAAREAAGDVR